MHVPPLALCLGLLLPPLQEPADPLLTVAESSEWRATATHAQVLDLCQRLAAASPRVHLELAGETTEGRSLPLLVIADPPLGEPAQVGERSVVFAWAGIHAGEVCGKPATLMLARELARAEDPALLEDLVVILMPLLNADGNDRMDPGNRPGQQGPAEGMGVRPNAQGLNINRDFTKLETPEGRAVAGVFSRWDPILAMDLHTTNGSLHRYTLTYDGPRHPAFDRDLYLAVRDELLPAVSAELARDTGYLSFPYGNFSRDRTQWRSYPAQPRYSSHYLGLRQHIGLLSEAYSYAEYRDRVLATLGFVRHSFGYVAQHADRLRGLVERARQGDGAGDPLAERELCLRQESQLREETVEVLGFDGAGGEEPGAPRAWPVRLADLSVPTLTVRRPHAYLVPAGATAALANLAHHGIEIETLVREQELEIEVYRIDSLERARRAYEGHHLVTVEVSPRSEKRSLPAGTRVVRSAQALGTLAAYLLEPQAEDGLCAWNFFDEGLEAGADYPVLRLVQRAELATEAD